MDWSSLAPTVIRYPVKPTILPPSPILKLRTTETKPKPMPNPNPTDPKPYATDPSRNPADP